MGPLLGEALMPMSDWGKDSGKAHISMWIEFAFLLPALIATIAFFAASAPSSAHPGGLAADGCHNDRKNGGRHCHRGSNSGQQQTGRNDGPVYYPNCDAARRAGVTPILRGQPGYGRHLDRDGDGKACE